MDGFEDVCLVIIEYERLILFWVVFDVRWSWFLFLDEGLVEVFEVVGLWGKDGCLIWWWRVDKGEFCRICGLLMEYGLEGFDEIWFLFKFSIMFCILDDK